MIMHPLARLAYLLVGAVVVRKVLEDRQERTAGDTPCSHSVREQVDVTQVQDPRPRHVEYCTSCTTTIAPCETPRWRRQYQAAVLEARRRQERQKVCGHSTGWTHYPVNAANRRYAPHIRGDRP